MFEKNIPITPEMLVRHDEADGLLYRVNNVGAAATGYEKNHQLSGEQIVNYTQLENGDFPVGTVWNREEEDFRYNFTPETSGSTKEINSDTSMGFQPRMQGDGNTRNYND